MRLTSTPVFGPGDPPGGPPATFTPAEAPWGAVDAAWNIGDAAAPRPWYEAIAEPGVRELMKTKAYANPTQLALAYSNLDRLQSGAPDVIGLPKPDAPPEEWGKLYTKLGRPTNAEGYDFKFGEGVQANEDVVKFGKTLAFDLGLNPKQAQLMADKWNAFIGGAGTKATEAEQIANQTAMTALDAKWAAKGAGVLEANRQTGLTALKSLGPDAADVVEKVEAAIGTAAVVELLALIGSKTREGGLGPVPPAGGDPNDPSAMTPAQAQQRYDALMIDPDFMAKYGDKNNPAHKLAVEQAKNLMLKATSAPAA